MATPLSWTANPLYRDAPAPKVFLRAKWDTGTAWVEKKSLYCDAFTEAANPEIPQATLSWRYGELLRPPGRSFEHVDSLDASLLIGQFVKIELTDPLAAAGATPKRWYGVIEEIDDDRAGSFAPQLGGDPRPAIRSGRQIIHCLGLEVLLERQQINSAWYLDDSTGFEIQVERGLQFNDLRYQKEIGNRSISSGAKGTYLFANKLAGAFFWSTVDAINYLLAYEAPEAGSSGGAIPWQLSADSFGPAFWWDTPRVASDKRTLKQLLDQLCDRRRLLGYSVKPTADERTIELHVFTYTAVDISFAGKTIPANPNTVTLDVEHSPDASGVALRKTAADQFDQVVVQGDRALACFSMSVVDGTLGSQWAIAEETDYKAAASTAGDYPTDIWERSVRNDHYRQQDRLKRVYAYFGLPTFWNGKVNNGENTGSYKPYLPQDDNSNLPRPWWYPGLRFEHHLPLLLNHDYTGTKILDGTVTDTTPDGQAPEFLPMFAVAKLSDKQTHLWGTGRYQYLESFAATAGSELVNAPFSASIRPQEDAPGIVLQLAGAPKHCLANADFTPIDSSDTALDEITSLDWKTQLIVTAALKTDAWCSAKWPVDKPAVQTLRKLVIDVGQEAQWHYVAQGTVVGVKDGNLLRTTYGGSVRDDRPRLQQIARFAYGWYTQFRQVLDLTFEICAFGLEVGQIVTALVDPRTTTSEVVNTVITQIRREFPESTGGAPPPPPRTIITTQMGQLDGLTRDALSRGR